jgi:RNA polymerase sigma-70 factor (ECF subfamily)
LDSSETSLIQRCRTGEPDAWNELFDAHYPVASRFVWQVHSGFSTEDVEEICQETFLTVIRSLESFQGQSKLQTWILRIASNKAHDYRERLKAQKRGGGQVLLSLSSEDPQTRMAIDPASSAPTPDQTLMSQEASELMSEALAILGGPCEEILELRYFADLSYEEIANSLKLNPKTVSSRLSKCLDKLETVARPLLNREKKHIPSV